MIKLKNVFGLAGSDRLSDRLVRMSVIYLLYISKSVLSAFILKSVPYVYQTQMLSLINKG